MPSSMKAAAFVRALTYLLTGVIGALAFAYPLLLPLWGAAPGSLAPNAPLFTLVVGLCFVALLLEVQGDAMSPKFTALLGVLVAQNAVLRFAETALPGPGGFSPIFFPILAAGYVYGARFGFLMGALTIFVSALITGGVGTWLPYQMLAAGWVGLSAPLCRILVRSRSGAGTRREVVVLTGFGGLWGFLFGALMSLSSWSYVAPPVAPGAATVARTLRDFLAFYLANSLVWDVARVAGNVGLMAAFGAPTLRALRRFQRRFAFTYHPEPAPEAGDP